MPTRVAMSRRVSAAMLVSWAASPGCGQDLLPDCLMPLGFSYHD